MGRPRRTYLGIRGPDRIGALGADGPALSLELLEHLEADWLVPRSVIEALCGGPLAAAQRLNPGTVIARRHRFNHMFLCYDLFCYLAWQQELATYLIHGHPEPTPAGLPGELGLILFCQRISEITINGRSAYWLMLDIAGLRRLEAAMVPPCLNFQRTGRPSQVDVLLPSQRRRLEPR